ncbi:MAG: exosortase N [Bacteroidota bacterium]
MRINYLDILFVKYHYYTKSRKFTGFIAAIALFILAFGLLNKYLISDFNLYLGLIFLPLIFYIKHREVFSNRYGYISLITLAISFFVPVLTLYYLAFCFALLFIIENTYGKINNGTLILILLIGSITRYLINIFSFSIRLKLTILAGKILNIAGFENTVAGNIIFHNGQSFSVDYECIGLKMVITSFILMLLFITVFERRNRMTISFGGIMLLSSINFILIVFTNLMRIVVLIVFRSETGSFSHEFIGLLSLLIYTLIPMYFIIPVFISLFGKKIITPKIKLNKWKYLYHLLLLIIISGFLIFNKTYNSRESDYDSQLSSISVPGFAKESMHRNVLKLYNEDAMVYVKPYSSFYGSDHNPYICWKGSGYEFQKINIEHISNTEIYTAELISDNEKLYTAWWYSNGNYITVDQIDWRWKTIKGENPFRLINISCETREKLISETEKIIKLI